MVYYTPCPFMSFELSRRWVGREYRFVLANAAGVMTGVEVCLIQCSSTSGLVSGFTAGAGFGGMVFGDIKSA